MPRRVEETDHYDSATGIRHKGIVSMTENDLKHKVLAAAYDMGWTVYHRPQTTQRNGGGSGYPDLTLARDGYVFWMELKTERGGLSPAQYVWMGCLGGGYNIIRPSDLYNGKVAELLA